jgi:16S rRNA (guanine527-N7)-methyltransferase
LENVQAVQSRVEQYQPGDKFDTVTARAFTAMPNLLALTSPLVKLSGKLLAMKSKENHLVEHDIFQFGGLHDLQIPNLDAERNVVIYNVKNTKA